MVRALANLDLDVTLTSDHRQALEADGLVVPGVGAFGAWHGRTEKRRRRQGHQDRLRAGRPVLGVCVGEQIMFERGMEHGDGTLGLGLIKGDVELLDADVVPHMGWDTVEAPEGSVLLKGVENERFYFVQLLCRDERFACRHLRRPAGLRRCGRACDVVHLRAQPDSWPPTNVDRCSPRSSIRRNPPKPARSCCVTGLRRSERGFVQGNRNNRKIVNSNR
ncbi:MAG: imidazole glycerol phosphate synthase subunit HisH [Bifidobacterium adolescentis]